LRWNFNAAGDLVVNTPYPFQADGYNIKTASYLDYKKMAWSSGVIHHDDVLYLSFELIRLFPFILDVIRARFPYFFIDEFQDISPIQLKILNQIIAKETLACVVGDTAQSIYGFLGAKADQLIHFAPTGIAEYVIKDNWRSTEKIVALLNLIRTDLSQKSMRAVSGTQPIILVGDKIKAIEQVITDTNSEDICTLTRDNLLANAIRKRLSATTTRDMIYELSSGDSNTTRRRTIIWCIKGIEYAEQGYFKDALKEIAKIHDIEDDELRKKKSLATLKTLLNNKGQFAKGSIM